MKPFTLALPLLVTCLVASWSRAEVQRLDGWMVEPDVDIPSYAVTEPTRSNLNIDTVVLVCEEAGADRILQLQLYLSEPGPLLPRGTAAAALKAEPRAEIVIDRHVFPVNLYFSNEYVLVADAERERFPLLSDPLLDAMASGGTMTLRLDLVAEPPGQPAAFDGEAVIDLQPEKRGMAIKAVRRCAEGVRSDAIDVARATN